MSKFQIIALVISLLWITVVIELVRRRKLIGSYSLLWLFTGIILIVFSLWENLLTKLTHFLGLVYPPSTFFALVIIFLAVILLEFSIRLSYLSRQTKTIAQKIAIMELEVRDKKNEK